MSVGRGRMVLCSDPFHILRDPSAAIVVVSVGWNNGTATDCLLQGSLPGIQGPLFVVVVRA